ncbi:MAG: hypothetical protein CMQ04_01330, partial [Gammaproteobacteria bacterium]|nr:hypothetical protein [Gammaproteobacteria bacterium]
MITLIDIRTQKNTPQAQTPQKLAFSKTKKTPQMRRFSQQLNVEVRNDLAFANRVLNTNLDHSTKGVMRVPIV